MPAPILGYTWTIQAGAREATKTVNGKSYLHCHLNQENSHERDSVPAATMLHSRWSSSTWDIADKPPSQPIRCRPMSGGQPRSVASVKENHPEDLATSKLRRRQQSDSMWTSGGAGTTKARPPLRRGKAFRRLPHGACRWTSGCRDRVPTPAPAPHRMIMGSSGISAVKPSVEMKDRDIFEITCMALCTFNMSGKPPASIKSPVSPPMKSHAPIVSNSVLAQMRYVLPRITPHAPMISESAYTSLAIQ
jgi:hypothetical protein